MSQVVFDGDLLAQIGLDPEEYYMLGGGDLGTSDLPAFRAIYEAIGVQIGTGTVSDTRTTGIYAFDENLVWRYFSPTVTAYAKGVYTDETTYTGANLATYFTPAKTNDALHSSDLTNAVWVKTGCNAAKDATGIRDDANGACTLTATAPNATCLQTVTAASGTHVFRAWIKRVTGTGTINITVNGGTTWTAVTLGAGFTECLVQTAAVTNPQIGVQIVTSGDAVEIDCCECVLSSTTVVVAGSSPVFTDAAPVSITACLPTLDIANHDDVGPTGYYFEVETLSSANFVARLIGQGATNIMRRNNANLQARDGTNTTSTTAIGWGPGVVSKLAVIYSQADSATEVRGDQTAWATGAYDGAWITTMPLFSINTAPALGRKLERWTGADLNAVRTKMDELLA